MLLLWSVLFILVGILLAMMAFSSVAIAISFFTKIMFFCALVCFIIAFILVLVERIEKKEKEIEKKIEDIKE